MSNKYQTGVIQVFDWIYKPIATGIMKHIDLEKVDFSKVFLEVTANEDVQKQIVAMSDQLYDRYMQKVMGTIGKAQSMVNSNVGTEMPNILNKKGQLNLQGLLPLFLKGLLGNKGVNQSLSGNAGDYQHG